MCWVDSEEGSLLPEKQLTFGVVTILHSEELILIQILFFFLIVFMRNKDLKRQRLKLILVNDQSGPS